MLNHIWFALFAIAFLAGMYHWLWMDNPLIWNDLIQSVFQMAKNGFDISLGLVGVLTLWLGLFAIAKDAGLLEWVSKGLKPLLCRLFPEIPEHHPAHGSITMNIAANMLGLDNASTPMGLKAMQELQTLNPLKDIASNAQIMFLVINTASVTLLPVTVFMYRMQMGAPEPAMVYIPILLATAFSTFVGILTVALIQRLPIFDWVVLAYFSGLAFLLTFIALGLFSLPPEKQSVYSTLIGNFILFSTICLILFMGWRRKVPVYETFVEGAKEGFWVGVKIIPYLVAMLVAVGVFRASGAMDGLLWCIEKLCLAFGLDTDFVPALPTAIMKSFSGSASRALMLETMQHYGVDSFPALVATIAQGSSETTFYVLAVYFGSVGITKMRYALACGLIADAAAIIASIVVGYLFFA